MKKLSKELLISGIFAILIIVLSLVLFRLANFNLLNGNNQVTDLSSVIGLSAAAFAGALALTIICVIIPIGGVIIEFLFTLIARLFNIGEVRKWKNIVSNIFFILALIIHILLSIVYIYIIFTIKSEIYLIPLFLSLIALVLMIIIYAKKVEK